MSDDEAPEYTADEEHRKRVQAGEAALQPQFAIASELLRPGDSALEDAARLNDWHPIKRVRGIEAAARVLLEALLHVPEPRQHAMDAIPTTEVSRAAEMRRALVVGTVTRPSLVCSETAV